MFFGNLRLVDPADLYERCMEQRLPIGWYGGPGSPNGYGRTLGTAPGYGSLLLYRHDLDKIDRKATYDLKLGDGDGREITIRKLSVTAARCVTPGYEAHSDAVFQITVQDRLEDTALSFPSWTVPHPMSYNYVLEIGQEFDNFTVKPSPVVWTWNQMIESLWILGFGDPTFAGGSTAPPYPGLPFTPHGRPDRFDYRVYGVKGRDALQHALTRLACAVKYDPSANTFEIVRLGNTDTEADAAVAAIRSRLLWSDQPQPGDELQDVFVVVRYRRVPQIEGVYSTIRYHEGFETSPPSTWQQWVILSDDWGYRNSGGAAHTTYVAARTAERVADWRRVRAWCGRPFTNVYAGYAREALTAFGSRYSAVAWYDRGQGPRTEIAVHRSYLGELTNWQPFHVTWAPPPMIRRVTGGWTGAGPVSQVRCSNILQVPAEPGAIEWLVMYEVPVITVTTGRVTIELYETTSGGTPITLLHQQYRTVTATDVDVFSHVGKHILTVTSTGISNAVRYFALFISGPNDTKTVVSPTIPIPEYHGVTLLFMWYYDRYENLGGSLKPQISNPVPV